MTAYATTLALCQRLAEAGLWLMLQGEDGLRLGPTAVARQHVDLLEQVRVHKPTLLAILRETLAYQVFGDAPGHFETEPCPVCDQPSLVMTAPRRLAIHRTPAGTAVCPGAVQAQEATAQVLMPQFLAERCVQRPGAILSWMALRGGLEGWAREYGWLLPPRPYLIGWMDRHYKRQSKDDVYASWRDLTFTVREWLGDEETVPAGPTPTKGPKPKPVLRA